MKTIYIYDYNVVNLGRIILVGVLLCVFIAGIIFFFPLLKETCSLIKSFICRTIEFQYPSITKAQILTIVIFTLFLFSFLSVAIIFCSKLLIDCKFNWVDNDISTCNVTSGKCEDFHYDTFESRDYVQFSCDFTVNSIVFSDVEISEPYENAVWYLNNEHSFDIYYREINGKNYVVRIDVQQDEDS